MNFKSLFRSLFSGRPPSRRLTRQVAARRFSPSRLERLEQRTLLAGNVTAQLSGLNAFINGDAADNSVELLVENGNVLVRGTDGTTINGSAADFVLAAGTTSLPRHLSVALGHGNDTFVMTGVAVGRDMAVNGGTGNDQIGITSSSSIGRNLAISGSHGDDTISVQDSSVRGSLAIAGNHGADMIIVSMSQIGGDLWVNGGAGSDDIVVDASRIGRDTRIAGWGGDDDIVIRNSELVDDLSISGHGGRDIIMFDSSTVGDKSVIHSGSGRDNIVIQGTSRFFDRLVTAGGAGRDNIEATAGVVFDGLRRRSFSSFTADASPVSAHITDVTTGALAAAEAAVAAFGRELTLTIDNASVSEGAGDGAATLTITRAGDTSAALEVTLASSNEDKLRLEQTTVTIPAGQVSFSVFVNPQDNDVIDGSTVVTITASAADLADGTIDVTVTDDDVGSLLVAFGQDEILEDNGNVATIGAPNSFSYTVSRTGDTTSDLVVNLTTDVSNEIVVPSTVTIPAGQSSVTFNDGETVADGNSEQDMTVVLTAAATGFQSGTDTLLVLDNDDPRLIVDFAAPTLAEAGPNGQTAVTITRNTDATDALNVTVTTQDPSSLLIDGSASQTVEIPAGQDSVTVTILGVDESVDDGDIPVAVFATATGFTDGAATITTLDDDDPTLSVTLPNGSTVAEDAGANAITARIERNSADTSASLTVDLSVSGDSRLTAPATATIGVGESFVDVLLSTVDNNIVDQPADGIAMVSATAGGFTEGSADVTVNNDDVATISLSPDSLTVNEDDGSTTLTVSRNDSADGETINLSYSDTDLLTGPASVVFAQGESTQTVTLTIVDNISFADNDSVTVTASSPNHASVFSTINIVNEDDFTTDISSNTTVQSVGTLITKGDIFTVTGKTIPGATVQADNDGNGAFDEASTTADANGDYSIDIPLINDTTNRGANVVQLRAVQADGEDKRSEVINVHRSVGTVVRFEINQDFDNSGNPDFYDVEMLDAAAPITVANFLSYTTDTATGTERFDNLLLQRLDDNFIAQAGRYNVDDQSIAELDRDADNNGFSDTIQNEFDAANSNLRGTLSMALPSGQPNGGSSEWFINVVDNAGLNVPQHTVFGRVIGDGMSVVDAINLVPIYNLNVPFNQGALGETPLVNSPFSPLTGTVALGLDSNVVTGTGTLFSSELQVGSFIEIGDEVLTVLTVDSDTQLTVDIQANTNVSDLTANLFTSPQNGDYVIFSNIGEILDNI